MLSVYAGYIGIPENATEKKNTLSTERNRYLEVGRRNRLLPWPSRLRQQPHLRKGSPRTGSNPIRRILFSFLQHFLRFNMKVLGILLRFSQARALVGIIATRTQSMIFNKIHSWEEESPLADIDLPLRGLVLFRFSLPCLSLSLSLSLFRSL